MSELRVVVREDRSDSEVLDVLSGSEVVVSGVELAKPPQPGSWRRYVRELYPGKYELGWERDVHEVRPL